MFFFDQLLKSLFCPPIAFYESTPLGRILCRVSSDLSILDLDLPFFLVGAFLASISTWVNLGVVFVITWQVLVVSVPLVYLVIHLQVSYGSELSNRGPTFDMDLSDFMDGEQPISYDAANRFFAKDPPQKWASYVAGTVLVLMTELGARFEDVISILDNHTYPSQKLLARHSTSKNHGKR